MTPINTNMPGEPITVSAVRVLDPAGRILLVRKRGTSKWMQPGGKPEPGEQPLEAAVRELHEEIGLALPQSRFTARGKWDGWAANEANTRLVAYLFEVDYDAAHDGPVRADAELAEIAWREPTEAIEDPHVAPLLREHVLPRVIARGGE